MSVTFYAVGSQLSQNGGLRTYFLATVRILMPTFEKSWVSIKPTMDMRFLVDPGGFLNLL